MSDSNATYPLVITLGRQMGCGGREVGKLLSSRLNIGYFDKELLIDAAKESGMDPSFLQSRDEHSPSLLGSILAFSYGHTPYGFYGATSAISDDKLYGYQSDCIRKIADSRSCVIVGRTADYILREHPRCVNIFLYASPEDCAQRILERGDVKTLEEARVLATRTNKMRASYYNFYTDRKWGNAATYDLCINTSLLSIEQVVDLICQYINVRYGESN